MATRPKAVIESRNGEKFSPITIAKNVLTDDGQNLHDILSDRKEDVMTPTIENSSSMFKVGQGDNVDYSANVVSGAYESMVLKGKTMVNCIQESSSKDVVLPYEFEEGRYVTINDTKESGALSVELKGQTLVNIHGKKTPTLAAAQNDWYSNLVIETNSISFTVAKLPENWRYINFKSLNLSMLKPNTKYLVAFEEASGVSTVTFKNGDGTQPLSDTVQIVSNKAIVTTTSNWVNSAQILYIYVPANKVGTEVKVKNPMIIEYVEGMENWDIPYFEGMASCKMPILHTKNNLFDGRMEIGGYNIDTGGVQEYATRIRCVDFIPINNLSNTTMEIIDSQREDDLWILQYDSNKNYLGRSSSFNIPRGVCKQKLNLDSNCAFIKFYEVGVTRLDLGIEYIVSDKTSSLSLPEEVVLRSLPNGVCDTFNTRTGVYTQRIGDDTFTGASNENWRIPNNYTTGDTLPFRITKPTMEGNGNAIPTDIICDKMKIVTPRNAWGNDSYDKEGLSHGTSKGDGVDVRILKSKLTTHDVAGFKAWLSQNPIRVQYQLHTPIVTKINLPSTLKSWNTTTHIYSEIPENTLYPILSHSSNPTYPVILKPSTKYSIVVNSYSNGHTNSPINFNLGGATASTTVGNRVTTITTPSTLSNELLTMSGRGNMLNNVMVIEGDVVGDEPYFEGTCDSKSPILSNTGKNLINALNCSVRMDAIILSKEQNCITFKAPKAWGGLTYHLHLKPNTTYTFSFERDSVDTKGYVRYKAGMSDWSGGYGGTNEYTFTTDGLGAVMFTIESSTVRDSVTVKNIMIEEATTKNLYESHKSNTTTFDQKDSKTIVLRSLPNGVCDTLNVETGEYIQNVVDIVLDGTENWILNNWGTDDNFCSFEISSSNNAKIQNVYKQNSYINFYCDTFKVLTNCNWNYMSEKHIRQWSDGNRTTISVIIPKSELKTYDVAGFIEYLTKNNIRINIRANNPIISTVDIQGFPYAYANGHVILSSGSIEQSLTPKVEYSVVTNRNGQIRSNQKMVERHQKQLDRLQAMILTNLVNTQYEQALTNLKYDLKNVREEVK